MLKPHNRAEVHFDTVSEIGANGRNSRTFVVRDHQLNADIVAKQVEKAKIASPAEFFAEAQALYASAHPNVVQIHYACQDADFLYLAMPWYRNGSVKEMITLSGNVPGRIELNPTNQKRKTARSRLIPPLPSETARHTLVVS